MHGDTAVLEISGILIRRAGFFARFFGFNGTQDLIEAVASIAADSSVERVVLLIDSPGGEVSGIPELGDAITALDKPVTAVVQGTAASAAYWIASQADEIIAGRSDEVGSIGVRIGFYDYSEMFEREGVEPVVIDTGVHKSTGFPGSKVTEEQREELQHSVDLFFDDFVNAVSQGRGLTAAQVREVGDGRMFVAREALEHGLIDRIGGLSDALQAPSGASADSRRRRLSI